MCNVVVRGRDLFLVKPPVGPPKKFQHQSWRVCYHPTWPYQGHQVPYPVPRTTNCLSPLWSNTDHWPYAPGLCSAKWMSWRILHSWLIEYSLRDNTRGNSSETIPTTIPTISGIRLSDMNAQTFYTILHLNHPTWCNLLTSTSPQTWTI